MFIHLCLLVTPWGGERGGEDRELWLSVVIIRSSFMNTDVHLPRLFHNLMSMRCFISLGELAQMMLIWPFASVLYMCSDIASDPYYNHLAYIDLYLFHVWNRTSVLIQTALLHYSLRTFLVALQAGMTSSFAHFGRSGRVTLAMMWWACTWWACTLGGVKNVTDGRTDGRTGGPTDWPTDRRTDGQILI